MSDDAIAALTEIVAKVNEAGRLTAEGGLITLSKVKQMTTQLASLEKRLTKLERQAQEAGDNA